MFKSAKNWFINLFSYNYFNPEPHNMVEVDYIESVKTEVKATPVPDIQALKNQELRIKEAEIKPKSTSYTRKRDMANLTRNLRPAPPLPPKKNSSAYDDFARRQREEEEARRRRNDDSGFGVSDAIIAGAILSSLSTPSVASPSESYSGGGGSFGGAGASSSWDSGSSSSYDSGSSSSSYDSGSSSSGGSFD